MANSISGKLYENHLLEHVTGTEPPGNRKVRTIRDHKGFLAGVLSYLSKAFDCIPHCLLIVKSNAFGFDKKSLPFISAYLY